MFTSRAELLDKGETTQEHKKNQKEEAHKVDEDKTNPHYTGGGLFGGLFRPKDNIPKPIFDIDDGVMRCPHCSWELEEGTTCGGCGYEHRLDEETDVSQMGDDTGSEMHSIDGLDTQHMDGLMSDEYDDIDDGHEVWGGFAAHHPGLVMPRTAQDFLNRLVAQNVPGANQAWRPIPSHYHGSNHIGDGSTYGEDVNSEEEEDDDDEDEDEEEEDDENEYDEADSFIDDEYSGPPTSSFVDHGHDTSGEVDDLQFSEPSTGTVVDDEDHGDDPSNTFELQPRHITPFSTRTPNESERNDSEVSQASSSDSEEDVRSRQRRRLQASRRPQFQAPSQASWLTAREPVIPSSHEAVASSEDSSSSPEPPLLRPPRTTVRRTNTGTSAGNAISLDDSDDDRPVGPVRRNTQRRRNRFSPY